MSKFIPHVEYEFSYFVDCGKLPSGGKSYQIEAGPEQREALAKRLSIDSLDFLSAEFSLKPVAGGLISLAGSLKAKVRQSCVVTLEPVISNLSITIDRIYSATARPYWGVEDEPDEDGSLPSGGVAEDVPDPPEPLDNGGIDLGEVASEELAIAIDPFPRIAGAELAVNGEKYVDSAPQEKANPFSVLEKLKKKLE